MKKNRNAPEQPGKDPEYRKFLLGRIILGLGIVIVLLWTAVYFADKFTPADQPQKVSTEQTKTAESETSPEPSQAVAQNTEKQTQQKETDKTVPDQTSPEVIEKERPRGVYFINQLIKPLEYELEERFWGWRPNDILNFTDNVNEIQVGILEVTRRSIVYLTERISRSGSAEALDPNLERAMNWMMVKAESFWFPSAETKYKDAIAEIKDYRNRLERGAANFYIRADNLIPLLRALEELLGSCDDNLVKLKEDDGSDVSTFQSDNYFFYAKGVAMAMDSILRGVEHDFEHTLQMRGGADVLEHAIHSCHIAAELDPWLFVTEGSLNGIFANHRANMAAHISHARFYLSLLVETLST